MEPVLELPDDMTVLHRLLGEMQCEIKQLKTEITSLQDKNTALQEQIYLLLHKRFGANTEKYRAEQSDLFNEAEAYAEDGEEEAAVLDAGAIDTEATAEAAAQTAVTPPRKPGRKTLPHTLPRVNIIHELPEAQRYCAEGHALKKIGEDISEQLDIIPAKVQVLRHIRFKYACPCCQAAVNTAPLPPQPIPKSNASPGLLAYIITSKFVDALPLNRQSKLFRRIGVDLGRATLANWVIRCGDLVQALCNLMHEHLLAYPVLQMDETRLQVLKEAGRAPESQSYLWVQRGGPPEQPAVFFSYAPSRSQQVADQLLQGFNGVLQSDAYAVYSAVCAKNGLRHAGCWAHARRKFDEAIKAAGKGNTKNGKASKALLMIQKLYRIEAQIKALPAEEKYRCRQQQAVPLLQAFKDWVDISLTQVTPSSLTGKALAYVGKNWATLTVYCEDGRLDIDNNAVERAIRPFVIGRVNWLFSDTVKGAKASANLYSLVETAKLNGLEPYRYLAHILKELPNAQTLDDVERLLPWRVDAGYINAGWSNGVDGVN